MPDTLTGPAYQIQTQRLVIRCWHPEDAPLLKAAIDESLDHLRPWMPWAKEEPTDLQTKIERLRSFRGGFDLGQDFTYGIFNRDETSVLGGTGLHLRVGKDARELGYWIHREHINQGFATEAAAALTKVAFLIDNVDRVEIHCDPNNLASAAIPKKLGFLHEATLRRRELFSEDNPRDTMIWTLFAKDYPLSKAAKTEIEAYDVIGRILKT